jgi:microcystin-dependent protein
MSGSETVSLTTNQIPVHNHLLNSTSVVGNSTDPTNTIWAAQPALLQYAAAGTNSPMKSTALSNSGGSQPHENIQPYLTINYLIALQGIFPSRN